MDALEFINIIRPEHDRTSCSDEDTSNSFYFDEEEEKQERSRCIRCSLLEVANRKEPLPSYFEPNRIFF
jgi:hypothetical protein